MIYSAYQAQADLMSPMRFFASLARQTLNGPLVNGYGHLGFRQLAAAYELIERAGLTHGRPSFGIKTVEVGNREVQVTEENAAVLPFGTLLRFKKDVDVAQPRVLVVAPLSGHFATLLVNTVKTMLPDHDVYITDWHNAREVPLSAGPFGFDDYVEHVIRFLEIMGPGSHLVAVCQPCVQSLVAAAVMAQEKNPAVPASMTLMAGPIDCRINPTKVNELATSKPISWFEKNLISTVPKGFAGSGRRVYPGFLQLTAFVNMNLTRHIKAHLDLYNALAEGDEEKAETTKAFYDEYFAVLDLAAEFYLETVRYVFQEYRLPKGELTYRGRPIDFRAIRKTALLTVEGERDDICSIGQTMAAQDICSALRPHKKRHHMQAGVGHYGVFSGRKWASQVYPIVQNHILASD
ncbi:MULTISPECIES: polyhydroxyalkanoate depolymerase [Xanthobacter]|uniref:polyhydroxyalkanoate depolymerase n=1 Tax=Xanthobacter TaxID=279 RepID=UPI001E5D9D7B|nr:MULTISPECIES: polyhydroxyalkanoate depolymerase [Xanthobacter]UDQ91022.1 polyhydroxyalkanoate depolymerase [Xanthobacter autotrophicus]UJX43392.1 polyhydroxyalkanoate depolymerase [Xanthobacter sp. YC-JY1]